MSSPRKSNEMAQQNSTNATVPSSAQNNAGKSNSRESQRTLLIGTDVPTVTLVDGDHSFMHGAAFRSGESMTFAGEAQILTPPTFYSDVNFVTDKVLIFGDATYHGTKNTAARRPVLFSHKELNAQQVSHDSQMICQELVEFSAPAGIARFPTGYGVEFYGPVTFNGPTTLMKPVFHGTVTFSAQPYLKDLAH